MCKVVVDRSSSNSIGSIAVGVITSITAVSATIEYGFFLPFSKSDQRRILSINSWSPSRLRFDVDTAAWDSGISNLTETSTSVNTLTTLTSITGTPTIPDVGDVIARFIESGTGDYDVNLETDYSTE